MAGIRSNVSLVCRESLFVSLLLLYHFLTLIHADPCRSNPAEPSHSRNVVISCHDWEKREARQGTQSVVKETISVTDKRRHGMQARGEKTGAPWIFDHKSDLACPAASIANSTGIRLV